MRMPQGSSFNKTWLATCVYHRLHVYGILLPHVKILENGCLRPYFWSQMPILPFAATYENFV